MRCKELLVRAWDSSQNGQPAIITWNLMGMMNNCYHRSGPLGSLGQGWSRAVQLGWSCSCCRAGLAAAARARVPLHLRRLPRCTCRIKIHPHVTESGAMGVRFQHPAPVELGKQGNVGWREQEKLAREGAEAAAAPPPPPAAATAGEQRFCGCAACAHAACQRLSERVRSIHRCCLSVLTCCCCAACPCAAATAKGQYTMEEVAQHSTEDSAWFVHEGKVGGEACRPCCAEAGCAGACTQPARLRAGIRLVAGKPASGC
jgi:hypothetical protein